MKHVQKASRTKTAADEIALVRRVLPRLLKEDPAFTGELFMLLSSHFTTREETAKILEEIRALREESTKRFEATEKRFEAMDRRFEAMDRRFEAIQKQMDDRFDAMQRQMDDRFEAVMRELQKTRSDIDRLGARWGIVAEDTFRNAMEGIVVKEFGGKVEKWKHDGYEIDFVISDGRTILVEIKSSVSADRVKRFLEACKAYNTVTGTKPSRRILVTMFLPPSAFDLAKQNGVEIFSANPFD